VPKLSRRSKLAVGIVSVLILLILGALFFPVGPPHVDLAPNYDDPFAMIGPFPVTNTLIASWMSIVALFIIFYAATRKMKLVPSRFQSMVEYVLETLLGFVESVAGKENSRRFFPIVATIFLYVLMNAWLSLLPFFNFIGYGHSGTVETLFYGDYTGFIVNLPLFRGANTDINVPLMLALVSFVSVEYWGITSLGFRHYSGKFFRFGQLVTAMGQFVRGRIKSALAGIFYGFIDVFVGFLELLSEFVRIISFTFRLFGNMTAGEILLLMMAFLFPAVLPVIFYGFEALIGIVQAFIFAALTLVFATMAVTPHESEH
jgi:F-type H+-transporting ATPase subunit a